MSASSDLPSDNEAAEVVARMGGPAKAAEFFHISQPAVSQWIAAKRLPKARRRHLQDLHPEWFTATAEQAGEQAQQAA